MNRSLPSNPHDPHTIVGELCAFARSNLVAHRADFNEHSSLAEAGLDSFSLVELLLFSERTFGITVPESHLTRENLASLTALADCINRLASDRSASPLPPSPTR